MKSRFAAFYAFVIIAFVTDAWSKNYVFEMLHWAPGRACDRAETFIPGLMSFFYDINTGISWSLFTGYNYLLKYFMLAAMFAIVAAVHRFARRHPAVYVALGMVLGGALGNWLDRFRFAGVRDFLHVDCFEFPLFNLADTWISIGAAIIIVYLIFERKLDPHLFPAEPVANVFTSADQHPNASGPLA